MSSETGFSDNSVCRWQQRFEVDGIEGLADLPRSGQLRKLTTEEGNRILRLTVEGVPKEATHWSLRLMAKYAGLTAHQVR